MGETHLTQIWEPNSHAAVYPAQRGKAIQSTRTPFFYFHSYPLGTQPLYTVALARALGKEQPFYLVDPYKYEYKSADTPTSLEEVAAAHLQSIRAVQPEGPYLLGGFCIGAYLAYEVARQLQAQGQQIELLLLVSPSEITYTDIKKSQAIRAIGSFFHARPIQQLNWYLRIRHTIRHITNKLSPYDAKKMQWQAELLARDPNLNRAIAPMQALYQDFPGVFIWFATAYTPTEVIENAEFVWAEENLTYRSRWSIVEQGKDSTIVPGSYLLMLSEKVDVLSEQLKKHVTAAQARLQETSKLASASVSELANAR